MGWEPIKFEVLYVYPILTGYPQPIHFVRNPDQQDHDFSFEISLDKDS
jgi:hypothetical protein